MVVVVEEVRDEAVEEVTLQEGEEESDFETDSEASDDDFNIADETLSERIAALKDIVPPVTRENLYRKYKTTAGWAWWSVQSAGTIAWWVSTSALLVGLPLALAIEDEGKVIAQEREMQMQSAGQQQLLGAPQQGQPQGVLPPGF
ncbi:hypothetical protein IAT38_002323 [Cryptococcus sp. DSM 104549]